MNYSKVNFLFLIYLTGCYSKYSQRNHKISMVSSHENQGNPALFDHGESPVWDADSQSLYFVDVHKQDVHKLEYNTGIFTSQHINYGQVNVVSLVSGSHRLLVAVRAALYLLDWGVAGDDALRLITSLDLGHPDNVINEGKSDAKGRFWAGTKGPQTGDDVLPDKATLYSVGPTRLAEPRIQLRPVSISNGLVWSLNNTELYYIDSPTQKVEAFHYDVNKGEISGRRTIIDISQHGYEDGIPDGMTIDSDGNLWVAIMFSGTVLHIDPDNKEVIYAYKLPVSRVSSVCWGGPALDELFVTTGKGSLDAEGEPLAGAIFTIRHTGSHGVQPHSFRFDNADLY